MTRVSVRDSSQAQVHASGRFPSGFVWGAATAAYQIEGAVREDGRGPSIWDTFSHTPGRVRNGDTGDVATDHYHRVDEDVSLLAELGLTAYRFSTSWVRVIPDGTGPVNQAGVDFYSRLVDRLLERGVTPVLTLYHWDLPQPLQDRGGWAKRETADHFARYAHVVASALGDRVGMFTTLNEPWCSAFLGYATGAHAPGVTDDATAFVAAHHLLLAHGRAVTALRSVLPPTAEVSITLNLTVVRGASQSATDVDAVRRVDGLANRMFLDPVLRGRLADDVVADTRSLTDWSFVRDGDLASIGAPIDVLGVNYYAPTLVAATDAPDAFPAETLRWPGGTGIVALPQPAPYTAMAWPVRPDSLSELLLRLHREYLGTPLLITENGAAFDDQPNAAGDVNDHDRIDYLRGHLHAIAQSVAIGVDVRGYFVWSLLDNFEWAWGYTKRFGIVHVDFDTLERRPKASARWYRQVIEANAVVD